MLSSKTDGLSHPHGARWNASNEAETHRLVLPAGSNLSNKVSEANGVSLMIERLNKKHRELLSSTSTSTWSTQLIPVYDNDLDFATSDYGDEVHVALGKCNFFGAIQVFYQARTGGSVYVSYVRLIGNIFDLYDFSYGAPKITVLSVTFVDPKDAARTQAGHATLATGVHPDAGKVFYNKVEIDTGNIKHNKLYK